MKVLYHIAFATICTASNAYETPMMRGGGGGMMGSYHDSMMGSSHNGGMMGSTTYEEMMGSEMMPGMGDQMMKCQYLLDEHCPKHECPEGESEIECPHFDGTLTMEEHRLNALNCVCCRDDGVVELQENNKDEEVSVMLARLLSVDSEQMSNAAEHNVALLVMIFGAFGVLFAIV